MSGAGVNTPRMIPAGVEGVRRSTEAMVRSLAGDSLTLRFPSPPLGNSDAEELGMGSPEFHDVTLAPVLLTPQKDGTVATVAAIVLEEALGVEDDEAVASSLSSTSFVQLSDELLQVEDVERRTIFGRAYLYRILLRKPELG